MKLEIAVGMSRVADETMDALSARGENLPGLIGRVCGYDAQRVTRFME